jgi:ribosome-associated protein
MFDLPITPSLVIPARDLSWTAVRASGPGGQNVNKLSTKVDLRFDLSGCQTLSEPVKIRLRALGRHRLDADGNLVIVEQGTRNQSQNLERAREKLAELVRAALTPPKKRKPTKPSRGSKRRRLEHKHKQAEKKRGRRRFETE